MKSYDSFSDEIDYYLYLYDKFDNGQLVPNAVDMSTRAEMLERVLSRDPPDGFYLEVGPDVVPYAIATSRHNIRYVAIEGGTSEYLPTPFGTLHGFGEYGWLLKNEIAMAATNLPVAANTRSAMFLWGDAQRLPFQHRDGIPTTDKNGQRGLPIQEAFMRDVLLESGIHPRSVESILREQARVLGREALLLVRETSYDRYYRPSGSGINFLFLSLLANLELTGFRRRFILFDDDSVFPELIRQYPGGRDDSIHTSGYYVVCQQAEPTVTGPNLVPQPQY